MEINKLLTLYGKILKTIYSKKFDIDYINTYLYSYK